MEFRPNENIKSYHVHVYYDGASKQWAGHLRREIAKRWPEAVLGRWRDKAPQGPHPVSHFQVAFRTELFSELVPWLALNRNGLSMLVHPNTGDGYEDHAFHDMWIGPSVELCLDGMRASWEKRQEKKKKEKKAANDSEAA
ncbi:MAG: DOPA 4,5-dioxygenase family protein [Rhodospirillales bacterium]|nr:DOPA 4,5-dioxygenase family protein [Rhodospirillales bacterium]